MAYPPRRNNNNKTPKKKKGPSSSTTTNNSPSFNKASDTKRMAGNSAPVGAKKSVSAGTAHNENTIDIITQASAVVPPVVPPDPDPPPNTFPSSVAASTTTINCIVSVATTRTLHVAGTVPKFAHVDSFATSPIVATAVAAFAKNPKAVTVDFVHADEAVAAFDIITPIDNSDFCLGR